MKKGQIPFSELKFPKAMNLTHLIKIMPEAEVRLFISAYARLDRKERKIMLPSISCLRKVICHYYWGKIERGESTWDEIKSSLRKEFKTLKSIGLSKEKVKALYEQRRKEIVKEDNS